MSSSESWRFSGPERPVQEAGGPALRVASLPLPRGPEGRIEPPVAKEQRRWTEDAKPAQTPKSTMAGIAGVMQRLATLGRTVLPLLPQLLPMDRRVGVAVSAVSSMVAARPQPAGAPRPVAPAPDPLKESISALQSGQSELRNQMQAQSARLKQLEEQMETMREAVARQAEEREELVASWNSLRKRTLVFGIAVSALLVASIACDVFLYLRH